LHSKLTVDATIIRFFGELLEYLTRLKHNKRKIYKRNGLKIVEYNRGEREFSIKIHSNTKFSAKQTNIHPRKMLIHMKRS